LPAIALVLCLTAVLLTLAAGFARHRFGSVAASIAYLRGEHVAVDEPLKSLVGIQGGSRLVVRYGLTNRSGHPIKLVGATSSCSCTAVEDLPKTLAAFEKQSVQVKITVAEDRSDFSGSIRLFTDDLDSQDVVLKYSVHVEPPSSPGGVRNK